ncbi:MAG: glycoside hydrolase family 16 protein [Acidobacteria bacterium]|nr:glycoside hydrolase family 16 protein [Acidobacteriota bacterium]
MRATLSAIVPALCLAVAAGLSLDARQAAPAVLFFDDFDGPGLNRGAWNVIVTGQVVNNEQQAYIDSPDTIALVAGAEAQGAEGGALALRALHRPGFTSPEGRSFDFVSARLDTRDKVTFTYGTAAARIKLTAGAGLWPAFWALGADRWPETGEIDIMENVGDPSWVNSALHGPGYSGNTPLVKRRAFPAGQNSTDWHVYSVTWTQDTIRFAVDDDAYYEVTKAMVEAHGRWAFDNPKFLIVNLALGGGYPQAVNKVTAPYPGLPQETVDLIKKGDVKMLVDWVRITGR